MFSANEVPEIVAYMLLGMYSNLCYAIFGSGLKVNIKNQNKFSLQSIFGMTLSIRNTNLTRNIGAVAVLSCVFVVVAFVFVFF